MASDIQITTFTARSGTGTQNIAIGSFGIPDAVLFFWNTVTAQGITAGATFGIGATDKSQEWAMISAAENGADTTGTFRTSDDDHCIYIANHLGTVLGAATYNTTATDGIQINWDYNLSASGVEITAVFFNVASAYAGYKLVGNQDAQTVVSDLSAEPTVVLMANIGHASLDTSGVVGEAVFSLGFAVNDGSDTQSCMAWASKDSEPSTEVTADVFSNRISAQLYDGALVYDVEIDNFNSTGFDLYARDGNANDYVCYLAIELEATEQKWVGIVDSPTSTGNDAQTGPDFSPIFAMELLTMLQAVNTVVTTGDAGALGVSLFDSQGTEYCHSIADEDGADTTNTESGYDDVAVYFNKDDGFAAFDATHVSMDATGWTHNFSVKDDTVRKWPSLAIGLAPVAGGVEVSAGVDALTLTEHNPTVNKAISFTAGVDALTLTEHNPTVNKAISFTAGVDALTLTEYNPTVNKAISFVAGVDVLTLTEYNPTVTVGANISVSAGVDALTLTEYNPTVNKEIAFTAGIDALTLTEYNPTVTVGAGVSVSAGVDELILTEHNPTVNKEISFTTGVDALTLTEYNPTVKINVAVTAGVDALTLTEYAAAVKTDITIATGIDALILTEYAATVTAGEVASGRVSTAHASSMPGMAWTSKKPGMTFGN